MFFVDFFSMLFPDAGLRGKPEAFLAGLLADSMHITSHGSFVVYDAQGQENGFSSNGALFFFFFFFFFWGGGKDIGQPHAPLNINNAKQELAMRCNEVLSVKKYFRSQKMRNNLRKIP